MAVLALLAVGRALLGQLALCLLLRVLAVAGRSLSDPRSACMARCWRPSCCEASRLRCQRLLLAAVLLQPGCWMLLAQQGLLGARQVLQL